MNSISNLIAFQSVSDSNYYNSQFIRMINRRKQELVEIQLESNNHISYTLPMIQSAKNNNLPRKKQENKCRYSTKKQIYIKTNYSNLREVRYFYFDSQDQYIRKILLKNGWIETKIKSNHQIDLAWINNDQKFNYQNSQIKFINHFKNNYLLTTKAGLKQTLYKNCSIQRNAEKYFPRCYDLHNELNEFIKDFEKTSVLNILKKYIIYISMDEGLMNKKVYHPSMISKKFMEWIKGKRKFQQHNKPNLLFHKKYLVYSIIFLQKLKNSLDVFIDCLDEHTEEQLYKIPDHIIQQMIAFSKIDPPYHEQLIDDQELWGTPTQQCISLLYSYEKYFEKKYEFYRNDGFDNIWIIKPSESSKGRNLQLISSKKQLKYHSQTCRVIQKYIENIWIFTQKQLKNYKDNNYPKELKLLLNKKFDIRLWVLVKSFEPLQIYLFSEGYLRLTSKNYNLRNLKNFREHFTNYSLNKQNIKKQESFVLLSTFLNHINFNYGYNHLLKEIEQIIISTLKCAEISYSNQSFQLYGFDVLLDCDLKPWLLEVNLSPACDERGKLKQILYKMGEGLLNQLELIDKQKNNEYNWRLIYNEKIENCDTNICNLQISGKPIKKQQLKLLQMRILISSSVLKIKNYFLTKCYKNNLTATERITSRTKVLISILSKNLKKVQFRQKSQIFDVINNFMKKRKSIRIRKSKLKLL